ncbi:unnamed protein product [Phytomonas sp. Hart1]|nr:unnamed protein product [Phytomonas sp. Hart1]|eukprot:CCW70263.1 unnamed protein product [Phytomonas sp. isolate Hart1]
MTICFKDAKEADCWCSLLQGIHEGKAWWTLARSLNTANTANMLLSRFFFQSMRREGMTTLIKKQIQEKLNKLAQSKFPRDLQGHIYLDDFIIGKHIPSIGNVSDARFGANGEVGFDMNFCYKGGDEGFSLYFRLALTYRGIRIPHIVFSVKFHHLEASLYVSVSPPPSERFWIGCHVPPELQVEVHQGCASGRGLLHRILISFPNLSTFFTNLIKNYFFKEMVLPFLDDFPLPSLEKTPPISLKGMTKKGRDFDRMRAAALSGNTVSTAEGGARKPSMSFY